MQHDRDDTDDVGQLFNVKIAQVDDFESQFASKVLKSTF